MPYFPKIVLHAPVPDSPLLADFVEACLHDKVSLICVIGENCHLVEDAIDWLILADGSDPTRFIVTTCHKDETLDDVLEFARNWPEAEGEAQQVTL